MYRKLKKVISYTTLLVICALTVPLVNCAYQTCAKDWIKKGCSDNLHNDLVILINDVKGNKINWDDYSGYLYDLACRCRKLALDSGYEWFAIGNYGMCLSVKGSLDAYLKKSPTTAKDKCIGVYENKKTIVSSVDGELCAGGEYRLFIYKIVKNGVAASAPADAEEIAAEEEAKKCSQKSDVILLIDVSGSVGLVNFNYLKGFLIRFLARYNFQNGDSRLGLIRYDEKCYIDLLWQDSVGKALSQLNQKVLDMPYTGGSTLTDNALKCALDKLIKNFRRPGVPITLFTMTDGESWNGDVLLPPIAKELKETYKCNMITVGVGNEVKPSQLQIISSNSANVFKLKDFKDLIDHAAKHLNNIIGKACV